MEVHMEIIQTRKPTTVAEMEAIYTPVVEVEHPMIKGIKLYLRIRRGLSPQMMMLANIPINNPIPMAILTDEEKADAAKEAAKEAAEGGAAAPPPELTLHESMKRIAQVAMVEPTFKEVEHLIGDDLYILSKITSLATGLDMFAGLFDANNPFRGGGQGDVTPELVTPGISG